MGSVATRKDLMDFLKNPENAWNLNGLVEDIRYALIDYQVCIPKRLALPVPDICSDIIAMGHLQRELPEDCESHSCNPTLM